MISYYRMALSRESHGLRVVSAPAIRMRMPQEGVMYTESKCITTGELCAHVCSALSDLGPFVQREVELIPCRWMNMPAVVSVHRCASA